MDNNRIETIFNKIINNEIQINDLSIQDILDLNKYLYNEQSKSDSEISLKKSELLTIIEKLSKINEQT